MTIESGIENAGAYIDTLDDTYPAGTDDLSEGDNHVRGIKNCLLNTFPAITGPITSTHTELNLLDGATVTTAEINYNDITTLGTVQASKTVTANGSGHVTFNTGSAEKRIYFDATSVGTANSYLYGQPDGDIGAYDTTNGRDIFVYSEANSNFIIGSALTLKANTITATTGNGDLNLVRNGTGDITVDTVPIYGLVILDTPESLSTATTAGSWVSSSGFASTTLSTANAVKAIIRIVAATNNSTGANFAKAYIRKTGTALAANALTQVEFDYDSNSGSNVNSFIACETTVNLDSNSDFDYQVTEGNAVGFSSVDVVLVGYYV